jgi:3-deoxy-manno-octulosonate cytidylyltransferase (CMP-KDO synthetase)
MKFIVAIPARLGSTRLPRKPLRLIAGTPLVAHVIVRAREAGAEHVVLATDSTEIADAAGSLGVQVVMTRVDHPSGTDRLAEVAAQLGWPDDTIVVNLQGDEPLAPPAGIRAVAQTLADHADCAVATLSTPIDSAEQLFDPNVVKVVADAHGRALYFSRSPLPFARDAFARSRDVLPEGVPFQRHIGIYAYRAGFLRAYTALPRGVLEAAESLEQLRVLEYGYRIAVAMTPAPFPAGVDTEADALRVEALLERQNPAR